MDDFFSPGDSNQDDDFLKREQAAGLSNDFGAHSTNNDGFEKDFESSASAFPALDGEDSDGGLGDFASPPPTTMTGGAGGGARQGGLSASERNQVSVTGDNEFAAFEDNYPELPQDDTPAPASQNQNQYNGFSAPSYNQPASMFSGAPQPQEQESEFIKSWKVKQAKEIAEREEASAKKKEENIAKARNAIDKFYKDYNTTKEKNIAKNKEEEARFDQERQDALAKGTTWDRICTLVDLQDSRSKTNTKSKQDLTRFKEILLALKREGDSAPGAGGY